MSACTLVSHAAGSCQLLAVDQMHGCFLGHPSLTLRTILTGQDMQLWLVYIPPSARVLSSVSAQLVNVLGTCACAALHSPPAGFSVLVAVTEQVNHWECIGHMDNAAARDKRLVQVLLIAFCCAFVACPCFWAAEENLSWLSAHI